MRPEGPGNKGITHQSDVLAREAADQQEELHLLKRLLVRTSLASEGQMVSLDVVLERLREQLRRSDAGMPGLRDLQDSLDRELIGLDERKVAQAKALGEAMTALIRALKNNDSFRHQKAALKKLERLPADYEGLRDQLPGWLKTLAEIQAETLGVKASRGEPSGGEPSRGALSDSAHASSDAPPSSWLRGLFRRERAVPEEIAAPSAEDNLAAAGQPEYALSTLREEAGAEDLDPQRAEFTHRMAELLSTLLGQLELEPEARTRVADLQDRLQTSRDWQALQEALGEVGELATGAIKRSQDEFEAFLKRLDQRLATLQEHFAVQSEVGVERRSESSALDETLSRNLAQLREDARRADDLAQLKSSVSSQVAHLSDVFRTFRENEQRRDQLVTAQVTAMQEKLAAMEANSDRMKAQLQQARGLALTDALTKLPNRMAFEERMAFEYSRWQRYGHPVSLVVLDIDHFKQVNDRCGHSAGDRVIQRVGRTLSENLRATDFVARYGGEEFVILLPETPAESALAIVDQLRERVGQLPFHFQKEPVRVSFSAGIAGFAQASTAMEVFDCADRTLYRAKANGRDQVLLAEGASAQE